MPGPDEAFGLIAAQYRQRFGARIVPTYARYHAVGRADAPGAALGFSMAGAAPLFLERYLDAPAEAVAGALCGRAVRREAIVEIGHFATRSPLAMIELWDEVAGLLAAAACEIAMATLTRPLREAMIRMGMPLAIVAPATAARAGDSGQHWGRYYAFEPMVCIGEIAAGQRALAGLGTRRRAA